MEENIARTIRNISSWEELKEFEINVRAKNRFFSEIGDAIKARASDLGRALIVEKTGLNVVDLSPAEAKIVQAVSEYVGVMRQQGKYPGRTFDQLRNRGLLDAAENAVCRARPTQGFQTLVDADLEDLSYEQIVIDHASEFSPRALWFSRKTLGLPNDSAVAPVSADSDTQTRTATLVGWLKRGAEGNDGVLPPFSNADAAAVMGMEDMQRFGQVHGNIQSRIDLACYLCGLPPLGLAARAPFEKAWSQEDRDWAFPIRSMQATAQQRVWSPANFDRILRETEKLPGQAHISWKNVLANEATGVKIWAFSFSNETTHAEIPSQDGVPIAKRNPVWARDELILALDLYLRFRASPPGKDSEEVKELSNLLNKLGRVLGQIDAGTYRNENGVYMKMMNFRRWDSQYTADGKVGLARGNKDEEVVWAEFSSDATHLAAVVNAIRLAVEQHADDGELSGTDEPDFKEAEEGRVLTRLHRVRERSRKLVEECKKSALKKHGRLFCEACGFDFSMKYGVAGAGLIDVHHTKPVHTLVEGDKTKLEDLAMLCSNCHRVVHSSRKWLTVAQVTASIQN